MLSLLVGDIHVSTVLITHVLWLVICTLACITNITIYIYTAVLKNIFKIQYVGVTYVQCTVQSHIGFVCHQVSAPGKKVISLFDDEEQDDDLFAAPPVGKQENKPEKPAAKVCSDLIIRLFTTKGYNGTTGTFIICVKDAICIIYSGTCLERPPHWTYKCGLSRQVVFGDRFNYIEM